MANTFQQINSRKNCVTDYNLNNSGIKLPSFEKNLSQALEIKQYFLVKTLYFQFFQVQAKQFLAIRKCNLQNFRSRNYEFQRETIRNLIKLLYSFQLTLIVYVDNDDECVKNEIYNIGQLIYQMIYGAEHKRGKANLIFNEKIIISDQLKDLLIKILMEESIKEWNDLMSHSLFKNIYQQLQLEKNVLMENSNFNSKKNHKILIITDLKNSQSEKIKWQERSTSIGEQEMFNFKSSENQQNNIQTYERDNRLNSIKLIWKNKSDSFATVGEILAFDEKTNFFTVITCIEEQKKEWVVQQMVANEITISLTQQEYEMNKISLSNEIPFFLVTILFNKQFPLSFNESSLKIQQKFIPQKGDEISIVNFLKSKVDDQIYAVVEEVVNQDEIKIIRYKTKIQNIDILQGSAIYFKSEQNIKLIGIHCSFQQQSSSNFGILFDSEIVGKLIKMQTESQIQLKLTGQTTAYIEFLRENKIKYTLIDEAIKVLYELFKAFSPEIEKSVAILKKSSTHLKKQVVEKIEQKNLGQIQINLNKKELHNLKIYENQLNYECSHNFFQSMFGFFQKKNDQQENLEKLYDEAINNLYKILMEQAAPSQTNNIQLSQQRICMINLIRISKVYDQNYQTSSCNYLLEQAPLNLRVQNPDILLPIIESFKEIYNFQMI